MKKCMITLLVVVLLCGMMLVACTPEEAAASNPGTTVPKKPSQPTQRPQPKPTETQPKPTETQPKPTETQPTEPPITEPILLNFTDTIYHYDDRISDDAGIQNIWTLNSADDLSRLSYLNLSEELAPYDSFFFDNHFLIVVEIYDHSTPGLTYRAAQVQQMPGGDINLNMEYVVERGLLVPGISLRYAYYLIIEVDGACEDNAAITPKISLVLVDSISSEENQ